MSEPSLRSTIADTVRPALAAAHFYGATDTQALNAADAVLRVIHTQRSAIADAAAAVHFEWATMGDHERDTRLASGRGMEDDVADAVLATLGADEL